MIKADIVKQVAERLKLKDKDALQVVDEIIQAMKEVICENDRLEVRDFGVFQIKQRKARVGRNPRNKDEYPIPPRKVVTFKIGKELKESATEPGESGDAVDLKGLADAARVPAEEPKQAGNDAAMRDQAPPASSMPFAADEGEPE